MAVTVANVQVIYANDDGTNSQWSFTAPTAGQQIIAAIVRGNGAVTGSIGTPNLDDTGFTHRYHHDPGNSSRGIGDVWTKSSATGTETALDADWSTTTTPDPESGQMLVLFYTTGVDLTGITYSSLDFSRTTGSHTVAADALDETLHVLLENGNVTITTGEAPAGDTQQAIDGGTTWRSAYAAVSGGNTGYALSYATDTTRQGMSLNINLPDAASSTLVTSVSSIAENAELQPDGVLGSVTTSITSGSSNYKQAGWSLNNVTDNETWNGAAWVAGQDFELLDTDSLNVATPTVETYDFTAAGELPENKTFEVRSRAKDQTDTWGTWSTRTFTTGTWRVGPSTTYTAFVGANPPTIGIDTPPVSTVASGNSAITYVSARDAWRETNSTTTDFAITGTATSAGSTVDFVEARADTGAGFGAWANVTNTGTNFSTWSESFTAPLAGKSIVIEVRSVDLLAVTSVVSSLTIELNAGATLSLSAPLDGVVLSPGGPLLITATGSDSGDEVAEARGITDWVIRLVDRTQGVGNYRHWDGTQWVQGPTDNDTILLGLFATTGNPLSDTLFGEAIPNLTLDAGMTLRLTVWPRDLDGRFGDGYTATITTSEIGAPPATAAARVISTDPFVPRLAGVPAQAEFRVVFGDVRTGDLLGQLPVETLNWSDVYNGSGIINTSLPIHVGLQSPIRAGTTTLWVEENGELVKGGIVWATSIGGNKLVLSAEGFHSYLRRRFITSTLEYPAVDQLTIAAGLVDLFGGAAGIGTNAGTSGRTRTRTYPWWKNKNVGEAVDQLAAVDDGFEFHYSYGFDATGNPTVTFNPEYPAVGRDRGLILEHQVAGVEVVSIDVDATTVSNTAITVGEGNDAATVRDVRSHPVGLGAYVPLEHVQTYSTVKNVDTLAEHAAFDLERRSQPLTRATVRITGNNPDGFRAGDQATVKADFGLMQLDTHMRIVAVNVSYDEGLRVAELDLVQSAVFV